MVARVMRWLCVARQPGYYGGVKLLGVACTVCLAACTTEEAHRPFEFIARFDTAGASVTVDDVQQPTELSYVFESYEGAKAELVLPVIIETAEGTGSMELRPGICSSFDVGEMLQEIVAYRVLVSTTPSLYAAGYECVGTNLRIWNGS
jgi:hypothetical protein